MTYLLECPTCQAVVGAAVKGEVTEDSNDGGGPWKVSLLECPKCSGSFVGVQENVGDGVWDEPVRVWPSPPLSLDWKIPRDIKDSLEEAHRCLGAKAYTASVVMSGRSLEAIGTHFYQPASGGSGKHLMLKAALDKLNADGIIDKRLHEWGLALHQDRNLAAHPSGTRFKKQDAEDVFKFARSICEYIFVLSADFREFKKRREARVQPRRKRKLDAEQSAG
jgi:hypothetical protein